METHYNPVKTEQKWYAYWMERGYFKSVPDNREPYTVLMPPPNVTGILHMGHMLNNTIQDILIRKARLDGKNACWVPGTDHASIATEAKVVQMLRERGIKKGDISREEFLQYAFEWKDKYGGIILDQLKRLGASADWDRTRFTMEEKLSEAVIHVFVDLYRKGRLYRAKRMTNWDSQALTVLSNEEVIYSEEKGTLYYLKYFREDDPKASITIATVRPETILGDTAIAVHPDDERYRQFIGKKVLVPLINRPIPVIADNYVDVTFGTGALKITPAHDQNDYEIGQRHGLETIDILTADGRLSEDATILVGEDRFAARKKILPLLEASGHLIKTEEYTHKVGRSERTGVIVEPRLTLQWFLRMDEFANSALQSVKNSDVRFYPASFENMFQSWLDPENIRDWCISRQLWWGQQIPAWYCNDEDGTEHTFVAHNADEALSIARATLVKPHLQLDDLHQDEDVVDTWFSSWLWPISVFDGFENAAELRYYYPTQTLVTGWDIIFFWVARMIMAGYEWSPELLPGHNKGAMPFHDVYFTGMVRDKMRRKMSKSLGNSPDALALLDKYGADGVRFGMLSAAAAGNDIVFDAPFDPKTQQILNESQLCDQGLRFCNKLWNALRLIKQWQVVHEPVSSDVKEINALAITWMKEKLHVLKTEQERQYSQFRLSEAIKDLYRFIWDDFCAWYLELIKPEYGQPIDQSTLDDTIAIFGELMTHLHPFMPFISEEIWHLLKERNPREDCIISPLSLIDIPPTACLAQMETINAIVTKIRELRAEMQISPKEPIAAAIMTSPKAENIMQIPGTRPLIIKMANLSSWDCCSTSLDGWVSMLVDTEKVFVKLDIVIDVEAERKKILDELDYYEGFVESVNKKLSNERFVTGAPDAVVSKERQKLADGYTRIQILKEKLAAL